LFPFSEAASMSARSPLFHSVARSLVRSLVKWAGNAVGFGIAGELIVEAWSGWSKGTTEEQRRAEVEKLAQDPELVKSASAEAVHEVAADQPRDVQLLLSTYLQQVPAAIRRTLRRPSDHTGRTVPPGFPLRKAEDLAPLLPPRLPRFKAGDHPLPGVNWELAELLGVGGFGEVWKAINPQFAGIPPVALKFCLDSELAKSLHHEASVLNRVMAQGRHPGIVMLRQAYLSAEPPCLEYEYVEGSDLTGLIQDWQRSPEGLTPARARAVILRLAEIVGFAHGVQPPIVHRDLKPANILVHKLGPDDYECKIVDFGIGGLAASQSLQEATRGGAATLYQGTLARGTHSVLYASPQQIRGDAPDPRDDVHALGVIWYQMLTGELASGAPVGLDWPEDLQVRGMSDAEVKLLASCFASKAEKRPENAGVLAEKLRGFVTTPTPAVALARTQETPPAKSTTPRPVSRKQMKHDTEPAPETKTAAPPAKPEAKAASAAKSPSSTERGNTVLGFMAILGLIAGPIVASLLFGATWAALLGGAAIGFIGLAIVAGAILDGGDAALGISACALTLGGIVLGVSYSWRWYWVVAAGVGGFVVGACIAGFLQDYTKKK
jgi:serine/threonine protein kinase